MNARDAATINARRRSAKIQDAKPWTFTDVQPELDSRMVFHAERKHVTFTRPRSIMERMNAAYPARALAQNTIALALRGLDPDAVTDDYTYTGDSTRHLARIRSYAQYARTVTQTRSVRKRDGREVTETRNVLKYAQHRAYVRDRHGISIQWTHGGPCAARGSHTPLGDPAKHIEPASTILDESHRDRSAQRPHHSKLRFVPYIARACAQHGFHIPGTKLAPCLPDRSNPYPPCENMVRCIERARSITV